MFFQSDKLSRQRYPETVRDRSKALRRHQPLLEEMEPRALLAPINVVSRVPAHVDSALASSAQQVSSAKDPVVPPDEGPSGGSGGRLFFDLLARGTLSDETANGSKVTKVTIRSSGLTSGWTPGLIYSIQVDQSTPSGNFSNPRRGGTGGSPKTLTLNPNEYITRVYGTYLNYINSLHIDTNQRSNVLGGWGGPNKLASGFTYSTFSYSAPSGSQIISFFGRSGSYLDAIGVAFAPAPFNLPASAAEGPSGGPGGGPFSDELAQNKFDYGKPFDSKITKVTISSGILIDSIQVDQSILGSIFSNPQHGGTGGSPKTLTLGPNEYITGVSGTYGQYGTYPTDEYVASLRIDTNQRSNVLGGWGRRRTDNVPFSYSAPPNSQIISFLGRSGGYLDAIGVAFAPKPVGPPESVG